ncbi:MAG: hypothetical protein RJB01_286, partial [Actinomycetota bacterium]
MQSNNPVLTRYEKKPTGFYEEGRSAYQAASGSSPTATITAPQSAPTASPSSTPPQAPANFETITAAGGLRITLNDVVVKT